MDDYVKGNILDLVLTNSIECISDITVCDSYPIPSMSSDHFLVNFNFHCTLHSSSKVHPFNSRFLFSKGDYHNFNEFIFMYDFSSFYYCQDIEFKWCFLKSVLLSGCDKFVPKLHARSKLFPMWFNSSIRHHVSKLRQLRRRARSPFASVHSTLLLKQYENDVSNMILKAKSVFESSIVHDYAFKKNYKIFSYIRSLKKKSGLPEVMHLDDKVDDSWYGIAGLFNEYFNSVYSEASTYNQYDSVDPPQFFSDFSFTPKDVYDLLMDLDVSKAFGIDGIPNYVLKRCAPSIYVHVHHLFSECISNSYIPSEWKTHKIVPVYKKGDRSSVRNYRPISLLCCISKVLESIVFNNLYDFIEPSLSKFQFGFSKNRSTIQQLILFNHSLTSTLTKKSQFDVVYFDIKKAFDTVDHSILLHKLAKLGISGNALSFITTYLSSRTQCVSIEHCLSGYCPVTSGVPQGSILGPLLFSVYINDLPQSVLHSNIVMYADDTKCGKEIKSTQDCSFLQEDINHVHNWSMLNNLQLHEDKTHLVRFHTRQHNPILNSYTVNDAPVESLRSCKDLGVLFVSDLSWSSHIESTISKAYRMLSLINRTFSASSNVSVKKRLYLSIVLPVVTYGSPVWRPFLLKDILALEKIQKRATKFILNDYSSDYKSRLCKLHLLPLMFRLELNDVMFFVSSLKSENKDHFDILKYVCFSSCGTRSSSSFKLKHMSSKCNRQLHSYFFKLPRIWNSLPPIDPYTVSFSTIKSRITSHLIDHFLDNFDSDNPCTYHYTCPCHKCSKTPVNLH